MENSIVYSVVISSKAQKEIARTWEWYEERQVGLGDRFVVEVTSKLNKIQQEPELYTSKHKHYREVLIEVFPLLIIYRINKKKKVISILSVFHTSLSTKKKYTP